MKRVYLILAVLGFIAPNVLVVMESLETGNILLYTDPIATLNGMFANRISSIFSIDLLFAVLVFFLWSYGERQHLKPRQLMGIWLSTLLLGLAGGLPLFLYLRQNK